MYDEIFLGKERADLRMLYQTSVDDIKYAKSRQWATTYYVLLTFAAIIGFYTLIKPECAHACWIQYLTYSLLVLLPAFAINVLGMYHVMDTQKYLCLYRMRLTAISEAFEKIAKSVFDIRFEEEREQKHYYGYDRFFISLVLPFIILMLMGVLYIGWLLFNDKWYLWMPIFMALILGDYLLFRYFFSKLNKPAVEKVKGKLEESLKLISNSKQRLKK